jgi:CDP-diacylglycerol--glycerol-3-phosphate 3-phosphatidyltransferase
MVMSKSKYIIVNAITLSRVIVAITILFISNINYMFFAVIWVGLSDFLDGYWARRWKVTSSFGIKFDQYADKVVALIFLMVFFYAHQLNINFLSLLFIREILILIFRKFNFSTRHSCFIGKAKTFFLYSLFIYLSIPYQFIVLFLDIKIVLSGLVIVCSWFSFLVSIPKIKSFLVYFIGTTLFSSVIFKKAPGTIASFVTFFLLFFLLNSVKIEYKLVVFIMLMIFHFNYYKTFLKHIKSIDDDPSIYTLDESIVIILAWILYKEKSITSLILFFIIFRFFDIIKPMGINLIEKKKNWSLALRNISDDLLAMLYTLCIFKIIQIYAG